MKIKIFLTVLVLLLNACGQAGKLYLPKPEAPMVNSKATVADDLPVSEPKQGLEL